MAVFWSFLRRELATQNGGFSNMTSLDFRLSRSVTTIHNVRSNRLEIGRAQQEHRHPAGFPISAIWPIAPVGDGRGTLLLGWTSPICLRE
jgi:hypothetical protein